MRTAGPPRCRLSAFGHFKLLACFGLDSRVVCPCHAALIVGSFDFFLAYFFGFGSLVVLFRVRHPKVMPNHTLLRLAEASNSNARQQAPLCALRPQPCMARGRVAPSPRPVCLASMCADALLSPLLSWSGWSIDCNATAYRVPVDAQCCVASSLFCCTRLTCLRFGEGGCATLQQAVRGCCRASGPQQAVGSSFENRQTITAAGQLPEMCSFHFSVVGSSFFPYLPLTAGSMHAIATATDAGWSITVYSSKYFHAMRTAAALCM